MRSRIMLARLLVAIAALLPVPVMAECAPGGIPSYRDITYVYVRQYSLVGIRHPYFEFEATAIPQRPGFKGRTEASLNAKRAVPYRGSFVAVDPQRAFDHALAVLEQKHFYDMHLTPGCCYIDGPEDVVTVVRCGVKTSLATISEGGQLRLDDAAGKAFFQLEDELLKTIFLEKWTMPTPAPR
jgi:hypothetical protein